LELSADEKELVRTVCEQLSGIGDEWSKRDGEMRKEILQSRLNETLRNDQQITHALLESIEKFVSEKID
jgi:hypothetical protein